MTRVVWQQLWSDERGGTEFVAVILVTALVAIGGIVGLGELRDQVTQELGDVAVALDNVDQSYTYNIQIDGNDDGDFTDVGIDFTFTSAYVDNAATLLDPANAAPACLTLGVISPTSEGGALPAPTGEFP
jgi:hypothetical protein